MILAVSFDFYGTLVQFDPPGEVIQASVLREFGLAVEPASLRMGYTQADAFMACENGRDPVTRRAPAQRDAFFAEYERVLLCTAGVDADDDFANRVWQRVAQVPRDLGLFDDVSPALSALKELGLILGITSNLDRDLGALTARLGIRKYLDFWVTSREVGHYKPHPAIFREALRQAGVEPQEAIHIGDQYHSDVEGAKAIGMHTALLDRLGVMSEMEGCLRIRTLADAVRYLQDGDLEKSWC